MKILITESYDAELFDRIQQIAHLRSDLQIDTVFSSIRDEQLKEIEDTEILVPKFDRELFIKAKKLRWVQVFRGGVDGCMFPEFLESDIILTCGKGIKGIPMSEHAFALLLGLTRGVVSAARYRKWRGNSYQTQELYGKVIGIIGFGGAGREIALRAHVFGMKVIAIDINDVSKRDFIEEIWKPDQFFRLLHESDVVMVSAPLTDRTRGMFNRTAFQQMKHSAFLINVSRGKIIEMDALIEALQKGWIAGAGLDVVPKEPVPPDSPLWQMENVIITPHIASSSPLRQQRHWALFMENLRRWVNHEPLLGLFERQQGF